MHQARTLIPGGGAAARDLGGSAWTGILEALDQAGQGHKGVPSSSEAQLGVKV